MNRQERLSLLARAWDDSASGYDAYFVPRFTPWLDDALQPLQGPLPDGALAAPCCGTGPELPRLATMHPGREIFGVDLSPGMVGLARARVASAPGVRVLLGDATAADGWPACAGLVSVFGLQQMPEPSVALAAWARVLVAGGLLSVVYWPGQLEADGPFVWLGESFASRAPAPNTSWEGKLIGAIEAAGAEVLRDERIAHEMRHDDATAFWQAALDSGPGRSLVLTLGAEAVAQCRESFLRRAPSGPLVHRPEARWLVARRKVEAR